MTKQMPKLLQLLKENASGEVATMNIVRNEASNEATIHIYDVIDEWFGISAESIAKVINVLEPDTTLHIRVNSPGGSAFEGVAIANLIRQFSGKTIAYVDGLAASAATHIVNAADEVIMGEGSFYMIHNTMAIAYGNKEDFSKQVALLNQMDEALAVEYSERTGKSVEQIKEWLNAETWFSAEEAVEHGFANEIVKGEKLSNRAFNLSAFDNTPKNLINKPKELQINFKEVYENNERRLSLYGFEQITK